MKALKFLVAIIMATGFLAENTVAQQEGGADFFIKVYGGYGLLTPGSYTGGASTSSSGSGTTSFNSPSKGLGAGLHFGGGLGVILSEFLNLGVDVEYLKGANIKTYSHYESSDYFWESNSMISHNVTSIIPNITFKALSTPTYYIYTRIGIILAVNTTIKTNQKDSSSSISSLFTYDQTGDYVTKLSLGTTAAIGVQFNITENLKGFGEIVGFYLPSSPSSLTIAYNSKSVKPSDGTTISENHGTSIYNYKKSGEYNLSSPYNQPKTTNNINYIGLNIGVAYKF